MDARLEVDRVRDASARLDPGRTADEGDESEDRGGIRILQRGRERLDGRALVQLRDLRWCSSWPTLFSVTLVGPDGMVAGSS